MQVDFNKYFLSWDICIVVGAQLLRKGGPINWLNHSILVCLYQAKTWISKVVLF
jgi:hypothetical protein